MLQKSKFVVLATVIFLVLTFAVIQSAAAQSGIWSVSGNNTYYNAGNVGIGTTAPVSKLQVVGAGNSGIGLFVGDRKPFGAALFETDVNTPGTHAWFAEGGNRVFSIASGGVGYFKGHVGIGVDPDTRIMLYVKDKDDAQSVFYAYNTGKGTGVTGASVGGWGVVGEGTTGVAGFSSDPKGSGVNGQNTEGGTGVVGFSNGFAGVEGGNSNRNGVYGHTSSNTDSGVYGQNKGSGWGVFGSSASGTAIMAQSNGTTVDHPALRADNTNPTGIGIWSTTSSSDANVVITNNGSGSLIKAFSSANGGGDSLFEVFNDGSAKVKSLTITGGADLAEPFQMSTAEIPRGAVVVIDDENVGKLKLSDRAYDHRVAGIVSGANGIKPGIALHQDGAFEGGQNVALSGRVYVLADASSGAIKPGDLLTTSSTPGHAAKVTNHTKAQGAVIGKAMSALKDGKGMVLVLITLQ